MIPAKNLTNSPKKNGFSKIYSIKKLIMKNKVDKIKHKEK